MRRRVEARVFSVSPPWFLRCTCHHRLDGGPAVGVGAAPFGQVVSQGPSLVAGPGLERGDELRLVDEPVLQRDQAEEKRADRRRRPWGCSGDTASSPPRPATARRRSPAPPERRKADILAWTRSTCQPENATYSFNSDQTDDEFAIERPPKLPRPARRPYRIGGMRDLFALGDSVVAFADRQLGTLVGAIQIRDRDVAITSRFPGPLSDTLNEEGLSHDDPEG